MGNVKEFAQNTVKGLRRVIHGYRPVFEQHIALFGESGSGKTTLLTVFHGYQQDIKFQKEAGYRLLAKDTTQGQTLSSSYFNLTESSVPATRLSSRAYDFSIRPYGVSKDAGRLVWYDYPGEWWTETKEGIEQEEKEKTFLALLSSDIALFLVDGAKWQKDGERYLKRLFLGFRDGLARLRDMPFLKDEFPLHHFPRIWIICLSKADLFPEMTAEEFKKIILKYCKDEMQGVKEEINGLLHESDMFSFGEDYLLLSVAQYAEGNAKIKDAEKRLGVDLIAPLAFVEPVKRSLRWAKIKGSAQKTTTESLEIVRKLTTGWLKWVPLVGYYFNLLDQAAGKRITNLKGKAEEAAKKGRYIDAVLLEFERKLTDQEIERTYIHRDR